MNAAISPRWPEDDPLFDLNSPPNPPPNPPLDPSGCEAPSHPEGPCPVDGLEVIAEELEMLALAASVRRDARLALGEHAWEIIADDDDVQVVIPA